MNAPNTELLAEERLQVVEQALSNGALAKIRRMLNGGMAPADVAHLLESSPQKDRVVLWNLIESELDGEVLQYLGEEVRAEIVGRMTQGELLNAVAAFETDDLVDLLQELPERVSEQVLQAMDFQDRERIEAVLSYSEDTAGGLMNTDTITVRPDVTLDVAFRFLRRHPTLPDILDNLLVVNRRDEFIGILPLNILLTSDSGLLVRDVMRTETEVLRPDVSSDEVARRFQRMDLVSAPVVSDNNKLLGRITIDDVVDVIKEQAEHALLQLQGLDEDVDLFAPVLRTARRRGVWLGINLLTAFIASAVIGLFEATLQQVVALAVLMPIVASMGGIAGTQSLTIVIRAMALGQITPARGRSLVIKEISVGLLNGIFWSCAVALVAYLWFGDATLGAIIGISIVVNLATAALAGTTLPGLLKRIGVDPALAGGVLLTTITDVVGFFTFLGLAALAF
ncbi:magnesium transporter [Litorivicinus lipolyticus]|uniref:Magnesium transporter MgtE n=1 Tax=Litorivicinus lipolyticus TaxID=418701 RepID=A0A5Q2QG29_9GAMM|nr:magnesium transporter [Litorivicinus lipolyticus]QGG80986.1 magnesium transporter [Litorivicinus lipolyticus]